MMPDLNEGARPDGHDHVPLLVSKLDVPVGLDDLLQRIAAIDDRPERSPPVVVTLETTETSYLEL